VGEFPVANTAADQLELDWGAHLSRQLGDVHRNRWSDDARRNRCLLPAQWLDSTPMHGRPVSEIAMRLTVQTGSHQRPFGDHSLNSPVDGHIVSSRR
jgi:hypothetical protein